MKESKNMKSMMIILYSYNEKRLFRNVESLISEELLKPRITFKRNVWNIRYMSYMVDIGFRNW